MKIRPTLLALILILALTACTQPTAAPSAPPPPSPTDRATFTPTPVPPTETATPSPTATVTASPTPTLTPTATFTPRPQHPPLITFTMEQNGVPSIYAIAPDGSGLTQLAADVSLYNYNGPLWSPDGQNIAFLSGASWDTGRVNILNYATGETRQVDFDRVSYFTWSPDGQQIAFTTYTEEDALFYPIILVSLSDLRLNKLYDMPTTQIITSLDWSPQGQSILGRWHAHRGWITCPCLFSLSGEYITIDNRGLDVLDASWSPTGEQFVFTGNYYLEEEKYQTWLVSADGTQGQLIIEDTYIESIDWSPDGSMLVYSNYSYWREGVGVSYESQLSGVYVYFLDTGTTIEIVPLEDFALSPVFSPDSAYLVYLTATQDVENTGYALNVYSFATGTSTQIVPAYVSNDPPTWRP